MSGEIQNKFFDDNPKIKSKSGTDNTKNTAVKGTNTFNTGSIFMNPDSKITPNQVGGDYELFMQFDLDGDGVISGKNSKGENEFALLNKAYEDAVADNEKSGKGESTNPIIKMYNRVVNFFKNDTGKEIYFDGQVITANGKIDGVRQSETLGDCWLLSSMNAMADTDFGAEAIRNAVGKNGIIQNDDGSYTIKIDRIDEEYTFSRDEIQSAIESNKYSQGDLDVLLFEMAFEKHYDAALTMLDKADIKAGRNTTSSTRINSDGTRQSSIDGGLSGNNYTDVKDFRNKDIISIMTGSTHLYAYTPNEKENVLKLKSEHPREIAATFSSAYSIELGENGTAVVSNFDKESNNNFETHAYELKRVEKDENGKITNIIVVNPWNNEEEIPLSEEEFYKYCIDIDFNTKNEQVINEYQSAEINAVADKIKVPDIKYASINLELSNIEDIALLSQSLNGLKGLHEKYMSSIDGQTKEIYEAWQKDGVEGMNQYINMEVWNSGEETTKYLNEFMGKSHQERVRLNKTTFYTNLGFDDEAIKDLLEHPEKFEKYCKEYGYEY